ncbi:hypothetical protein NLG97_g3645 [Lecanicillium saksenae]|uniref:Uncharacterized protein n=1 Tax=Lecanicillium saksenae TaxID=468837 RepID=A0ACC1QZ83_9HYPO|nr:hypothetical protein NLG97_g3645 [Lecanicillium saksenae]
MNWFPVPGPSTSAKDWATYNAASGYFSVVDTIQRLTPNLGQRDLFGFTLSQRTPYDKPSDVTFKWQDNEILQVRADLGDVVGRLPIEVVHLILNQLNIAALARLQAVSQGMKRAVGSLPMLRAVLDTNPGVIPCIAAAKYGAHINCRDLYSQLCRPACSACDDAGTYLYLLTCERVCFSCLVSRKQYRPLRPQQAKLRYCLTLDDVQGLPGLIVPKYSNRKMVRDFFALLETLGYKTRLDGGWSTALQPATSACAGMETPVS